MVKRRFRRAEESAAQESLYRRNRRRRDPHARIDYDPDFSTEGDDVFRGLFYGLGADGTVGANKNSIKIIGEDTPNYAQGYFVYDSRKAGAVTVSHLRFGPKPIHSTYLINKANFIACHQFVFLERYDMLKDAVPGATFLLTAPSEPKRSGTSSRAACSSRSSTRRSVFTSSTATRWPRRPGWAPASTRSCRPASSPSPACCRAKRRSTSSSSRSRRPTAPRAKRSSKRTSTRSSRRWRTCSRSRCPRRPPARCERPPVVAVRGPGLRAEGHAGDHHRQPRGHAAGQRLPRRRHIPDRDGAVGEAQHRARNSRLGSRDLHPVRQVRDRLPARGHPHQGLRREADGSMPRHLQVDEGQGERV